MRPHNRREPVSRRAYRPSLEGLETRELLATIHRPATSLKRIDPALLPGFVNTLYPATVTTTTATTITVPDNAPGQIGGSASYTSPAGTYSVPQPTTAQVRREEFVSSWVGRYVVGPPRYSDQAATIHIYSRGNSAGSNQFLKGRSQILLFPPADPAAQPTPNDPVAGQTVGLIALFPSNTLASSDILFFDVHNPFNRPANDPSVLDHGLPSHLVVTYDPLGSGVYSGFIYATTPATSQVDSAGRAVPFNSAAYGALDTQFINSATGVLDIKYLPGHHTGGTFTGTVVVKLQVLVNFAGISNSVSPNIN